jgi:uncharacterized protein YrrD
MTDYTASASGAGGVSTDETSALIASNKVEGTAVYNRAGEHLGKVYNFMVNKRSGQVEYAVLSFGGFLAGVFEPQRLHAALEQRSRKAYASSAHAGLSMAAPQEPC